MNNSLICFYDVYNLQPTQQNFSAEPRVVPSRGKYRINEQNQISKPMQTFQNLMKDHKIKQPKSHYRKIGQKRYFIQKKNNQQYFWILILMRNMHSKLIV
ncbi:unnamed protein product [Paramecium pentaurelia]|uniref:Uncharacterized protein n=1 Tax=Paramecium pentaurelia TaxID=43138 RepID=A0A8S1T2R7_9CILI|nr:unnamed protein product [Paramecium pentaurelia]